MRIVINTLGDLQEALNRVFFYVSNARGVGTNDPPVGFANGDKLVFNITEQKFGDVVIFDRVPDTKDYPHPGHDGDPGSGEPT